MLLLLHITSYLAAFQRANSCSYQYKLFYYFFKWNNFSAFAWDNNNMSELHSEYGYITVENGTRNVSMNTIMSNG